MSDQTTTLPVIPHRRGPELGAHDAVTGGSGHPATLDATRDAGRARGTRRIRTGTVTRAAVLGSDAGLGRISIVSTAFALGWQLAEIDLLAQTRARASLTVSRTNNENAGKNSKRRELLSLRELALQKPDTVLLPQLGARLERMKLDVPNSNVPSTARLEQAWSAAGVRGSVVRPAICDLHARLAGMLSAVDGRLAAAYDLGREIAYATQAPGGAGRLHGDRSHHDEISQPLADLSSAFPEHSSRVVQLSLAAWHEWLDLASLAQSGRRLAPVTKRVKALRVDPAHRPLWRPKAESKRAAEDTKEQSDYLKRQGQVWRALLAGEKDVESMMDTSNYEKAAHQLFRRAGSLVWRLTWTNKWAMGLVLALIGAGTYAVISFNGTAKVITFGTAVLGVFGVTVKSASTAVGKLSTKIGKELWGAEVDIAAAQAITRLPNQNDGMLRFDVLSERHRAPGPSRGTACC